MKYYIRNFYNNSLQIRNTQLRLIRYVRKWNLKNPTKPISRFEIKEIGRIEFKRLNILKRCIVSCMEYFGLENPFREVLESIDNDELTQAKAYNSRIDKLKEV